MANPWTTLVQQKFRLGRMTNPAYNLGQAMKAAKKVYKKGIEVSGAAAKIGYSRKTRGKKRNFGKQRKTRGGKGWGTQIARAFK
jgi:hypothetical protein